MVVQSVRYGRRKSSPLCGPAAGCYVHLMGADLEAHKPSSRVLLSLRAVGMAAAGLVPARHVAVDRVSASVCLYSPVRCAQNAI